VVLVIDLPFSAAAAACSMRSKNESPNSEDDDAENTSVTTQQELAETQHADLGADDYEADDDTSVLDEEVHPTQLQNIYILRFVTVAWHPSLATSEAM
jgi:hypothetical protein